MKIAIVGTGAMGCVYAALLADAGHDVWAVDTWREHVDAMRANGLHLEGVSGDRIVRLNATSDTGEVGVCDLVIIATKAMHVIGAAQAAQALLDDKTTVISIQNGLGGPDMAAEVLGRDRVSVGVVGGFGASMVGPGHAHHNGMELVRFGEREGAATPRLERAAKAWESAGFKVKLYDDIRPMIWEKLIFNCCFSSSCTLTGFTTGKIMADADAWAVASGCALEADAVARALAIPLSFDDPIAFIKKLASKIPNARPSMLLDHLAGRPGEVDVINGSIPKAARGTGVPTPVNETVVALIRAIERDAGLR